jgi:predicted ATPase
MVFDKNQEALINRLGDLQTELESKYHFWKQNQDNGKLVSELRSKKEKMKSHDLLRGLYIHGNPGSGKTFLMDMMYEQLDIPSKTRLHYNEFMLRVHRTNFKYSSVDHNLIGVKKK